MTLRRALCLLLPVLFALSDAKAQDSLSVAGRTVESQWLWGAGRANVLDTYLSPLEYVGPDLSAVHHTERQAHWGGGNVTTVSLYTLHGTYLHSPTDDGKEWDAELSAAGGWRYNWHLSPAWRIGLGGMAEATGGFTYNTRGSNNPAQGRLGVQIEVSALAEYAFRLGRKQALARIEVESPLLGAQFAPEYGQSYYEIFSLGHSSGVVHFTHPGNVPSARLQAALTLPLLGANITVGYLADVRQSKLGGLKRHAWRNSFLIGYTRTLRILR